MSKFSALRTQYNDFLSPSASISIGGETLAENYVIESVSIALSVKTDETSSAFFKVYNMDNDDKTIDQYTFLDGFGLLEEVEISLGYEGSNTALFKGLIFERNLELLEGGSPGLIVYCLDHKALLRGNVSYESHKDVSSLSDIVTAVTAKYSFSKSIGDTEAFTEAITVSQFGISDFDYIQKMANETDYEFFMQDKTLYFREPRSVAGDLITFGAKDVIMLQHRTSVTNACSQMIINGYNQDKSESKKADISAVTNIVGSGSTAAEILRTKSISAVRYESVQMNKRTEKDLTAAAKAHMDRISLNLTELTLKTWGVPEAVPGRFIKIEEFGSELNDSYYVVCVYHKMDASGYEMQLICVSNTTLN